MSEPMVVKSGKNLKRVAVALLLAAALLPFVVSTVGPPLHKEILRSIGKGFFWVVIMYAAIATLMRSRPEIQQARVRVAIAACMLGWCGMLVAAGRVPGLQPETTSAFATAGHDAILRGLESLIDTQIAARNALDARFAALDRDVLAPERLVSAAGVAKSRATLNQYSALNRESDEFDRRARAAREAYLDAAALTPAQRTALLAAIAFPKPAQAALEQQLAAARHASMGHATAVLDFAESRLGKSKLIDGDIQFFREADVLEYSRLRTDVLLAGMKEQGLMNQLPN